MVCLSGIAIWAWPDGVLSRPLALINTIDILWALLSLAAWIFAFGWAYLVFQEVFPSNPSSL